MECAICYEQFFIPKNKEELVKLINKHVNNNNNYNEITKFKNLLITPKHNETHICSTLNCGCLICRDCWIKITHKGNDIMNATEDDMPTIYDKFICPYCRNVDCKNVKLQ